MKLKSKKTVGYRFQSGFTLMEVLVSIFLMAFGLLALVAMQVKTQGGLREAESFTTVAMAVDSLAEGMGANPTLTSSRDADDNILTTKSWSNYLSATALVNTKSTCTTPASAMSKDAVATMQVCMFKNSLVNLLPKGAEVYVAICKADAQSTTKLTPSATGLNCAATGGDTMIKVAWTVKADKESVGTGKLSGSGNKINYSYQVAVNAN